jgi:diaminopimelate decarboxylase
MSKDMRAPIAFRVNPDVSAGGHEKISTGKAEAKFGVPWERSRALYAAASRLPGIDVKGVDVHIGSQISALAPFEAALKRVGELIVSLRGDGISIERLDLGGGLGIPYEDGGVVPPSPAEYAQMIRRLSDPLGVQLIFEPGRMITGNAGILVTRTIYRKTGAAREFLIVDTAMNDLIRPALYDAFHAIRPVIEPAPDAVETPIDIVGPVCETGDRFAIARAMPPVAEGDLVAIMSAGAYGAVQASQYNTRPLVPEVMVNDTLFAVIRRRPSFDEMIATEVRPDWL